MDDYLTYHRESVEAGDIDPSYSMLRYICNRFELNIEQRYWLAWIYATCYCGATTFYIYNEFPDFENVDEKRLSKWWDENKQRLVFQTDRKWVHSKNQWVDMFKSYRKKIAPLTQERKYNFLKSKNGFLNYTNCWKEFSGLYQFGRFAMFLYLEAVHVVTDFPMRPSTMNINEADSCRNGLALAINKPELNNHSDKRKINAKEAAFLQQEFDRLVSQLSEEDSRNTVWNIETSLCAYKKYCYGKRYVGYYIDRQKEEIKRMEQRVSEGVHWGVLWEYRAETFNPKYLKGGP